MDGGGARTSCRRSRPCRRRAGADRRRTRPNRRPAGDIADQREHVGDEREARSYADAAMRGSSYLKLPRLLQFFTGNIGLHHVHHLHSRIPNYNLQRAHDANPMFAGVPTLSLRDGPRAVKFKLWDEEAGRLVTFAQADPARRRALTLSIQIDWPRASISRSLFLICPPPSVLLLSSAQCSSAQPFALGFLEPGRSVRLCG
ncbi:MAG: fatty acid desaturase [Solirubrobacterales bacterium]|nr:fatty acid desaturase [Solirubrobacterales bacterium]